MVLLLSSDATALMMIGGLFGALLGLLYRVHTLSARTTRLNIDLVDMCLFGREHLRRIDAQVTHLQAVLKIHPDAEKVLEYL